MHIGGLCELTVVQKIFDFLNIKNYLKNTNLNEKLNKFISIKNNSESFISYKIENEPNYYLEDILNLMKLHIKDKNKKLIIIKL